MDKVVDDDVRPNNGMQREPSRKFVGEAQATEPRLYVRVRLVSDFVVVVVVCTVRCEYQSDEWRKNVYNFSPQSECAEKNTEKTKKKQRWP